MTDTASSILLLRLQSTGSNTNLWGGYLNTAMSTIERASKGYQELAVTGDATISWTNYSASNDGAVAALKLTGSPAASSLTFPSKQHFLFVYNATSATITIKCSGGTGVALATGQRALLWCDATDFYNAAPTIFPTADITFAGKLRGVTAGSAATDAVNKTQMETAIATLLAGTVTGLVLVSSGDTTADYFQSKFTTQVTGQVTLQTSLLNAGANEKLQLNLTVPTLSLSDGGTKSTAFTSAVNTKYVVDCISTTNITTLGPSAPQVGDLITWGKMGTGTLTFNLNGLKFKGSTTNPVGAAEGLTTVIYSGASRGWVDQ